MKIRILSIGNKPPAWVSSGFDSFMDRFASKLKPVLIEIPAGKRHKDIQKCLLDEKKHFRNRICAKNRLIALDEGGEEINSSQLAKKLNQWMVDGRNVEVMIGGSEGLHKSLISEAEEVLSLSRLTLPHHMARLVFIEALYRASSILMNHPYHRD